MNDVLAKVGTEIKKELQQQIMQDTYSPLPNKEYFGETFNSEGYGSAYPTWEFYYAWKKRTKKGVGTNPGSIEIYYDPSNFTEGVHDDFDGNNMKDELPSMLNQDGWVGSTVAGFNGGLHDVGKNRKPYWKNFIEKMKGGIVRNLIKQKASENGIKLT